MKHKALALLTLPLLLLSSCDFFLFKSSSIKELSVYNLDLISNNDDIEDAEQTKMCFRFVSGRDYVPYLTLKQYASLYNPHFAEDAVSEVTKSGTSLLWTVYRGDELYFVSEVSTTSQKVYVGGALDAAFKDDDNPTDTAALEYGMETEYEGHILDGYSNYATYSFSEIKLDYFSYGGEFYFPLSFLDITYSFDSGIYFFYNYNAVYSSHDADAFEDIDFRKDNRRFTANSEMEATHVDYLMPSYLKQFNANMFFYLMNNFYGFKDYITDFSRSMLNPKPSMAQFCKNHGLYDDLFSSNGAVRAQAYADALSYLDDNHTAIVSANSVWGEDSFIRFKYSTGCQERSAWNKSLTSGRKHDYEMLGKTPGEDILYSRDGKTAMYMFDSFMFGKKEDVFKNDGTVNYSTAVKVDTYFNLIDTFQKIKNHGGVENIVLDISTNGGGVLGVMMKVLALISNNDASTISYMDEPTRQAVEAYTKVDINGDGEYNTDDCFGDDFNFYILTSDCSFSCANAFPCFAKTNNFAKIIGQKSGGGECAVAIHFLPNSQYVYHSSNLHLGYYDAGEWSFTGFESGAEPDIPLDKAISWYDVDYLNESIARYENQTN